MGCIKRSKRRAEATTPGSWRNNSTIPGRAETDNSNSKTSYEACLLRNWPPHFGGPKDLPSFRSPGKQVLRFAQDDNSLNNSTASPGKKVLRFVHSSNPLNAPAGLVDIASVAGPTPQHFTV